MLVEDSTGKVNTFIYETEPLVTRNSLSTTFDQLRVGDEVTVKTDYDVLAAIDATATAAEATAIIKEITIGNTSSIKLQDKDGEIKDYKLSNTAKISVLNTTCTIYDLRVGYKVSVSFDGSEIISIDVAEKETSQEIVGKIVYVNVDKKLIMLQVVNDANENETMFISLDSKTTIMNLLGQTKRITDLKTGDSVISVGTYSGGTFNAVSVIIK